jgi:hypothetical protein
MTQRTLSNLWMPRARKRFPLANRPYSVFMKDSNANAELQGKGYFPDDLKACLADKKPFMYRPMAQLAEEDDRINDLIKGLARTERIRRDGRGRRWSPRTTGADLTSVRVAPRAISWMETLSLNLAD